MSARNDHDDVERDDDENDVDERKEHEETKAFEAAKAFLLDKKRKSAEGPQRVYAKKYKISQSGLSRHVVLIQRALEERRIEHVEEATPNLVLGTRGRQKLLSEEEEHAVFNLLQLACTLGEECSEDLVADILSRYNPVRFWSPPSKNWTRLFKKKYNPSSIVPLPRERIRLDISKLYTKNLEEFAEDISRKARDHSITSASSVVHVDVFPAMIDAIELGVTSYYMCSRHTVFRMNVLPHSPVKIVMSARADGTLLKPLVLCDSRMTDEKDRHILERLGVYVQTAEDESMTNLRALAAWDELIFRPEFARVKKPVMLLVDGPFAPHVQAIERGTKGPPVVVCSIPSDAAGALLPLDSALFPPTGISFGRKQEVLLFPLDSTFSPVRYQKVSLETMMKQAASAAPLIKAGFVETGVWPMDMDKMITASQTRGALIAPPREIPQRLRIVKGDIRLVAEGEVQPAGEDQSSRSIIDPEELGNILHLGYQKSRSYLQVKMKKKENVTSSVLSTFSKYWDQLADKTGSSSAKYDGEGGIDAGRGRNHIFTERIAADVQVLVEHIYDKIVCDMAVAKKNKKQDRDDDDADD